MLEKLRMVTFKQILLENLFSQRDHQGSLEEEKFRLTDKMQASDPAK